MLPGHTPFAGLSQPMLVSHQYKFIYLKTTKTGGTSTEVFLQAACEPPGTPIIDRTAMKETEYGIVGARGGMGAGQEKPRWYSHMPASTVRAQIGDDIWQSYVKVGNVRNPFSRAVSVFYQRHRAGAFDIPKAFDEAREQFCSFICSPAYPTYEKTLHIEGEYVLDDVIIYERLQQDIRRFCQERGLNLSLTSLPHYKRTTERHSERNVAEFFDGKAVDRVRAREHWCFERFGYSSDPAHALELPALACSGQPVAADPPL